MVGKVQVYTLCNFIYSGGKYIGYKTERAESEDTVNATVLKGDY